MKTLVTFLLLLPALACAGTLYKSVAPDGRVVYSDRPPDSGKVEQTFSFESLPASPMPESVSRYRQDLEKSMQKRLADSGTRSSGTPVIFVAQWCGYCRQAEAYLKEKKIGYQRHDIETPEGKKAMVDAGAGGRGIPVLFSGGQRVVGYSRGAYDALFAKK